MTIEHHPRQLLSEEWIDIIRKYSPAAEKLGQLHPEQVALIFEQGWFKALVAKQYGGLEWTLPQIVGFEEAIGWADGSVGWVFTLCSGAGWFSGFLEKDFAAEIFADPKVCLAGSGAPAGEVKTQANGHYLVSGNWPYASGAPFASIFTANCYMDDKKEVKAFCFLHREVTIQPTWHAIGLVASASDTFSVDHVEVPKERCFEIDASKAVVKTPLYQYPFEQLALGTIAANLSGMTLHFLEEVEIYLKQKKDRVGSALWENEKIQAVFQLQLKLWASARNELFTAIDESWRLLPVDSARVEVLYVEVYKTAQHLAKTCRIVVNTLYGYTGLTGANVHTPLNRVWRDFQTGSQHALFMDR